MTNERYNFQLSEPKWQKKWEEEGLFQTENSASTKEKYYVLEMFPYPSGNIHMGHVRNYTLGDVMARLKRAQGFDVLHPMGWDAFGLPAENAAIENNVNPADWTYRNIETMREQLKSIGLSYDWSREIATCSPDYYKHEQKFFLEMVKSGLAYRKEAVVNWDPVDHTVLANEQVIDGKGWRSGADVERKTLSQWFLAITNYADDLLASLETLKKGWPAKVLTMQEKWIGKSYGASIHFAVSGGESKGIDELGVYTTRPDTLFGMSFCGISPDHPIAKTLAKDNADCQAFLDECSALGTSEEAIEKAEKRGFDTGLTAQNPFNGKEYPIYIANFVMMDYGTGAVFACPAHDQRDLDFARKYNLDVVPVVAEKEGSTPSIESEAYTGDGVLVNSDFLNGLPVAKAKEAAIQKLEDMSKGTRKTNYRLRDWGISRQRYWGCPIPMIHCESCGIVPVPEDQLPVTLPKDVSFEKAGNPLAHHPTWKHVDCPECGKAAIRETDTFDTFFESSWYFARFCSMQGSEGYEDGLNKAECDRFLPVDCYVGGIEHAVLHLLYSRFFTRALKDLGHVSVKEPFKGLQTQGMVCHQTFKDTHGKWLFPEDAVQGEGDRLIHAQTGEPVTVGRSEKMSKSKKNVVDPKHILQSYGTDTARLFMLSDSPPDRDLEWTDSGIDGAWRYINRLWKLLQDNLDAIKDVSIDGIDSLDVSGTDLLEIRKKTHATLASVTENMENFHYNKAVALIREFTNRLGSVQLQKYETEQQASAAIVMREAMEVLIHLIAPLVPHLAESMWEALGEKDMIAARLLPKVNPDLLVKDELTIAIQVNGKLRSTLSAAVNADKKALEAQALSDPKVVSFIEGKTVRKVIVVPNKIVNIVAA